MATSAVRAVLVALESAIDSQLSTDGVTGVATHRYEPTGDERTRTDWVAFLSVSFEQEPMTQGGTAGIRMETLTVDAEVRAYKSGGTLDDKDDALNRAETIFASVETAVRDDPNLDSSNGIFNVEVARGETTVTADDQGAYCVLEFEVEAEAHL